MPLKKRISTRFIDLYSKVFGYLAFISCTPYPYIGTVKSYFKRPP